MTGIWATIVDKHTTTKADLGELASFGTRTGCDKTEYVDIHLTYGTTISMDLATWCGIVRRAQEQVATLDARNGRITDANCAGACFDTEEAGA